MDRKQARQYLKKIEFNTDRQGIDELLAGIERAQAAHPGLTKDELLNGMNIDDNDEWYFDPDLAADPEWLEMLR